MGTEVSKTVSQLPAHLQSAASQDVYEEFAGGVTSGFSVISYRGKVWRYRKGGEEQIHVDANGEALGSIEVVLLRSNPRPSKTYYEEKYSEGDKGKPRCFSADGLKPDKMVVDPINPTCQTCPMNEWGSKVSESGKPTRACQDVRRIAVITRHEMELLASGDMTEEEAHVMLLRVPPASLNPLRDYAERVLKPKSVLPHMLVTRVGFDNEVAYPKLTFKGTRFLNEQEFAYSCSLRDADLTRRIINEVSEYDEEETTDGDGDGAATRPRAAEGKPKASSSSSKKMKPVEEDDLTFSEEIEDAPKRATELESEAIEDVEDVDDGEIAAAPKTKKKKRKKTKTKAKAPETKEEDSEDDFDAMLQSILD